MGLPSRLALSLVVLTLVMLGSLASPQANASPRSNDEPSGATKIHRLPFDDVTSTAQATSAATDPATCLSPVPGVGHTVWYSFRPRADSQVTATTDGSNFDTVLAIYTYDKKTGSMTMVACNDDAGGTLASTVNFDAMRKHSYFVMVGSFASGPGGNLTLRMT